MTRDEDALAWRQSLNETLTDLNTLAADCAAGRPPAHVPHILVAVILGLADLAATYPGERLRSEVTIVLRGEGGAE